MTSTQKIELIGQSPLFVKTLEVAKRIAKSSANIFISGESGTGKELFAKYIHNESQNQKGPFVAINCSAIPDTLIESELFGHTKGAFSGALENREGLFEAAHTGTLFLDEIGDLNLALQAKLLRVIQDKKIKRVGENRYRDIDCRIISATHKNLETEIHEHRFREDLFFRLDVIPLHIPALREHPEDIVPLAHAFLQRFANENHSPAKSFSQEAIQYITNNPWRGNVRELENSIERAVVLCNQAEIALEDITHTAYEMTPMCNVESSDSTLSCFSIQCAEQLPPLKVVIQKYIEFAVQKKNGARDKTAKEIGIDRKTLYKRLGHLNKH